MDETSTNPEEELAGGDPETPEDVAVLYTWANVHGGKYRDFSASRREFRAQQRHRMVEAQRQAELEAAQTREEAARLSLEEARRAEEDARHDDARFAEAEEARRRAEQIVEQERLAAQRHVETAEELKLAMEQAQREMEEARLRAEEQASRWREADARWRALNGDREFVPGETDDPYYFAGPLEPTAFAPGKGVRSSMPARVSSERRIAENYYRSRDESRASQEVARRTSTSSVSSENPLVGMFSSGRRNPSAGRPAYRERVEPRIETPEDTQERGRSDERYRLTSTHRPAEDYDTVGHYSEEPQYGGEAQYDDNPNDAYYDRMPDSHGAGPAVGRNTAPRGLHIPPRAQALRSSMESSGSRAAVSQRSAEREIVRSEDPQPGNAHILDRHSADTHGHDMYGHDSHGHDSYAQDTSRLRRRESAEDVSARTARRPRSHAEPQRAEGFGERARRIGNSGEIASYQAESRENPAPAEEFRHTERAPERAPQREQPAQPPVEMRDDRLPREQRPEWLVRNAPLPGDARYSDAPQHNDARPAASLRQDAEAAAQSAREYARDAAHVAEGRYDQRPMGDAARETRPADPRDADLRNLMTSRRGDRPPDPVLERIQERIQERGIPERREHERGTREIPAAEEPRQRVSQTVRAADGGFNLRPLTDRAPGGNLPPLRDRPSSSGDLQPLRERPEPRKANMQLRPVEDAPPAERAPARVPPPAAAEAAQSGYADTNADRRRYPRPQISRGNDVTRVVETAREDTARAAEAARADAARLEAERARYSYDSDDDRPAYLSSPIPPAQPRQPAHPSVAPASEGRPARTDYRVDARNEARADARDEAARAAARDSRDMPTRPAASTASVSGSRGASTVPVDTLQQSRERVAARWFALKGLMGNGAENVPETPVAPVRSREMPAPMLSVVSLSGGVGKTSLVATLGRSLSSAGEKVLLADTTTHGLLPYYFGARELRPDVVRTFSPPPGSSDAPVYMVNYETDRLQGDEAAQGQLVEEIARHARGTQRVLLDLSGSSAWLARLLARQNSTILVPIAPDMNSVLSIQNVERYFAGAVDSDGRAVQPYYVLNQFDASLPLHLDVREVLRQQLGDRLLPVMIRRSPSVAEALAEGMTVIDYAPEAPVTEDYIHLAEWVRKLAAPAVTGLRSIRWSER